MKKSILLLTLFSLITFSSNYINAQRTEDVVYLSNGSIIHGQIVSDSSQSKIRILNHSGDTWAFDPGAIDSIRKEKPFEYKAIVFNQRGPEFSINTEFLVRSKSSAIGNAVIPGVNIGLNYRINPFISAGTEIGMVFYNLMEVPLNASLRIRTSKKTVSPFAILNAGYTLPAEKRKDDWDYKFKSKGGINTNIGIGLEKIINENASLLLSLTYNYQELNYHLTPLHQWVKEKDRTESYSRFCIKMGFVFR